MRHASNWQDGEVRAGPDLRAVIDDGACRAQR